MANVVGWFEIYVEDMERATAFYETVFGVSLEDMGDPTDGEVTMKAFPSDMTAYGAPGALVKMDGIGPGAGGTLVYFVSDDCAVEAARVAAAGGEVVREKTDLGEFGAMSLIKDTEGNVIGIHSMG